VLPHGVSPPLTTLVSTGVSAPMGAGLVGGRWSSYSRCDDCSNSEGEAEVAKSVEDPDDGGPLLQSSSGVTTP
jgi:hypothetical protein